MPNANVSSPQNGPKTVETYYQGKDLVSRNIGFDKANLYTVSRINSVNTPNFRSKRPRGSLPMNPITTARAVHIYGRGSVVKWDGTAGGDKANPAYKYITTGCNALDFPLDKPVLSSAEVASLDTIARNKLLLKVKDQKVNLAQALAEKHQVSDMIAKNAKRIADSLVNLKRGNLASAADALGLKVSKRANARFKKSFRKDQPKAMSNGWLELQYGWRPLLNDIFGAAELLAERHKNKPDRTRVVASQTVEREYWVKEGIGGYGTFPVTSHITIQYTVKYVVYFSLANDGLYALNRMGLTNPTLIAWELMPWSFVIDWFLPMGNWIQTFDATLGARFEQGAKTVFVKTRKMRIANGNNVKQPYEFYESFNVTGSSDWVDHTRTVLNNWPHASFPEFKNPFGWEHVANALALLTQLKSKK